MANKQPAQTTQVSKVELPAWVDQASQENYQLAKSLSERPLEQYTGQTVAGETPFTKQAYDLIGKSIGSTDPLVGKATGMLDKTNPLFDEANEWARKAGGVQGEAADIFRSTAGPLDITPFLNQYTGEVEQNAIRNANESLSRNLLSNTDAARKSQAFGGSRAAIQNAVTQAEGSKGIGDLSAQLRKAGIDFATNTALQDRTGRQAAGTGLLNTGAGYLGTGRGILDSAAGMRDTATGYLNTATNQRQGQAQDIASLLGAGDKQRGQTQAELDAAARKFYEKRDYPTEALNVRLAALGMSPYGKTETSNKTSTQEKLGTDWATLGLGIAGLPMAGGGSAGGAAMSGLMSLLAMSDRDDKTDITNLGKDSKTGLPMYSYRYKGDPKTYPKVVGPMAQDIKKKFPKAVKNVAGHKAVDMGNLMEILS